MGADGLHGTDMGTRNREKKRKKMAFFESAHRGGPEKSSFAPFSMRKLQNIFAKQQPKSRPLTEEPFSHPHPPPVPPPPPPGGRGGSYDPCPPPPTHTTPTLLPFIPPEPSSYVGMRHLPHLRPSRSPMQWSSVLCTAPPVPLWDTPGALETPPALAMRCISLCLCGTVVGPAPHAPPFSGWGQFAFHQIHGQQ